MELLTRSEIIGSLREGRAAGMTMLYLYGTFDPWAAGWRCYFVDVLEPKTPLWPNIPRWWER